MKTVLAAIMFYTTIPVPGAWELDFRYAARWIPVVGLLIGGLLSLEDWSLAHLGMPTLSRSALLVASWLWVTGGLHMDGMMDLMDGLAVAQPERRLAVMVDSVTGAFGAMAAVVIIGLKWAALSDLGSGRALALWTVPMWGRWAQQVAIAAYPYLKPTGKGALHQSAFSSIWIVVGSGISCALLAAGLGLGVRPDQPAAIALGIGGAIALGIATGYWVYHKLGGHTGDTYGAVVEATEAGLLLLLTMALA